ncbi:MAG TPA: FkbM family methyltransferase [Candidatus Aquilonibacter sp.]|nr:FkbM family methyltransferase [Candidatus Aquilonibacter sp.]
MNRDIAFEVSPGEAGIGEELQVLGKAVEQLIQNVTTQGKINDAIVGRLLELEKRVEELTAGGSREARRDRQEDTARSGECDSAPTAAGPNATARQDCLPMYLGDATALCRMMKSFLMYVDTRDTYITPALLLAGVWEPAETRLLMQRVKAGMTVVDVDANCGYYTLLMGAAVGPKGLVYAFEPDPRNLDLLDRNLQVNGMTERVNVIPRAALDRRTTAELHQNTRNRGAHTLFIADSEHSKHAKIQVDCVPLDDVVEGAVDFVKIDAEGSEALILRGMKKIMERSPRLEVLMEFNQSALGNSGTSPREFLGELRGAGFAIHTVTPQSTLAAASDTQLLAAPLSTLLLTRTNT